MTAAANKYKRICIITPGTIGSNPRSFNQAQALHDVGYQVTVIATRLAGKLDLDSDFEPPWRVRYVDLRSKLIWRSVRAAQLAFDQLARLLRSRSVMRLTASPFTVPLLLTCIRENADLYIAHYPPALPAAAMVARFYGRAYAYDAEDFHLGDVPELPEFDRDRFNTRAIEECFLPSCAFVTAASPLIAEAVASTYNGVNPQTILNCFPKGRAPRAVSTTRRQANQSLYWYSQTIGPNRGIEQGIAALALSKSKPSLFLRGLISESYRNKIIDLARRNNVENRVHILAPAIPANMEILAAEHDLGLCGEPGLTPNNKVALSNKLFGFILGGVPPLMSDTPAQVNFAREAGLEDLIYPRGDAPSLARLIDVYLADPDKLLELKQRVWQLGQSRYNWDVEKDKFVPLVLSALRASYSAKSLP